MMPAPKRIQRRRTRGWRMPAGAVFVGRPTMWGNPFVVDERMGLADSLALYRNLVTGIWSPQILNERGWPDEYCASLYEVQLAWTKRMGDHPLHMIRATLVGQDLACWCPVEDAKGSPVDCHADILLELAN